MIRDLAFAILFVLILTACDPIEGTIEEVLERSGGSLSYTVSFDSDGGNAVADRTAAHGGKVQKPTDPKKKFNLSEGLYLGSDPETCTLEGWYNGNKKWDYATDIVTENITLTAHWTEPLREDISSQSGANIVIKAFNYTNGKTGSYTVAVGGTYSFGLQSLNTPGLKLTIIGLNNGNEYKISPSGPHYLFSVGAGELCLGNNITLAGYSPSSELALVNVNTGAVLTMQGSSKITGNHCTGYNGSGVNISGGVFNMEGGEISGNSGGSMSTYIFSAVYVNTNGTFNMKAGDIKNNTTVYGGAGGGVYTVGTFNMSGGNITGNDEQNGGGVYINGGVFTLSDNGNISNNTATNSGGGVYVESGTFNMTGGTISDNTGNSGGGIFVDQSGMFTMDGGYVSGNSAKYRGGGIYLTSRSQIQINKGTISNNKSATDGGGIWCNRGSIIINGGDIINNTAVSAGGGIYAVENYTMNGGNISYNTAATAGGVSVYWSNIFTMTGGKISNNIAPEAVCFGDEFTMKGGEISGNSGHGVHINISSYNPVTFTLKENGKITGNNGVGVYVEAGSFIMNGGAILNNAGGVYVDTYGIFEMYDGSISGNISKRADMNDYEWAAGNGAGVHNYGEFTMRGGAITGNKSADARNASGGGVLVGSRRIEDNDMPGTFTMIDGNISGNTASLGGGVCVKGGNFIMEAGNISANRAIQHIITYGGNGGGIYVAEKGNFTMSGGTIDNNTAIIDGGGVYMNGEGKFIMNGGEIRDNTASGNGGGVYNKSPSASFTMSGTAKITRNTANNGGGIASDNSFTMESGTISGNIADYGGGVASGSFIMKNGTISGNTAKEGGGVRIAFGGNFTMNGGEISGNTGDYGGGVFLSPYLNDNSITFTKNGGFIYGSDGGTRKNTARNGGNAALVIEGVWVWNPVSYAQEYMDLGTIIVRKETSAEASDNMFFDGTSESYTANGWD